MRELIDAGAVVDMTRALVAVDTQNPPGNEKVAVDVARQLLEPLGATFTEVEPGPGRTSLVATLGADDGRRPTMIVNGHIDVVPVDREAWSREPFGGEVDGDRLYGRGTADMKGGIASAIEALAALQRAGVEPMCDVTFHLVADEELGGALGAKVLLEQGLIRGDACIDPEPTSLGVSVAERGLLHATITVHGRPGHGSQPHLAISAVEKTANIALALHKADLGDTPHDLLGTPTCNAGTIHGGTAHNVVAEWCRLQVDRRLLPGMDLDGALASLRTKIDGLADPELQYDIAVDMYAEASELDPSDPFLDTF